MLQPYTRMVELHAGHLVTHERTDEVFIIHNNNKRNFKFNNILPKIMFFSQVNQALINLINASKSKHKPEEWSHIPERETGIYNLSVYIEKFAQKKKTPQLFIKTI